MNNYFKQQIIEDLLGYSRINRPTVGIEYERVTVFDNNFMHSTPIGKEQFQLLKDAILHFKRLQKNCLDYTECGIWKGIKNKENNYSITMEPGLQLEMTSGVYADLQRCLQDMDELNTKILSHFEQYGIYLLAEAINPTISLKHSYMSDYSRYQFMKNIFKPYDEYRDTGTTWLRYMMSLSASIQVNFDYFSADDMMRKLRAMVLLQPVFVALFSNSPFVYQKYTGSLSYRYVTWWNIHEHLLHTQKKSRCGVWPFLWRQDATVEDYVDYVIDLPMLFLLRKDQWLPVPMGYTFNDLLHGKLINDQAYTPTIEDWRLHNSTTFPDVRSRQGYLEIRFLDTNDWYLTKAAVTCLHVIFYDEDLIDFILSWPKEYGLREDNYDEVLHQIMLRGLTSTMPNGTTMQELARQLYNMVQNKINHHSPLYEYLQAIDPIITSGRNLAQDKVQNTQHNWQKYMNLLSQSWA